MVGSAGLAEGDRRANLIEWYRRVRHHTVSLCKSLDPEDFNLQVVAETSPAKWHLAHTTWFFDQMLLSKLCPTYRCPDEAYNYLFNSYYQTVGAFHPRSERRMLARPLLPQVLAWRQHVDEALAAFIAECAANQWPEVARLTELGLHHEQQHQELLIMDLKRNFYANPMLPTLPQPLVAEQASREQGLELWQELPAGFYQIGASGAGFSYDNERPQHQVWLPRTAIMNYPVTNAAWREFMADGGYERVELWLAEGWDFVQSQQIKAPLYWFNPKEHPVALGSLATKDLPVGAANEEWLVYDLSGVKALNPWDPVLHVSFYEAQAFAKWRGCRLASEFEWEAWATTVGKGAGIGSGWEWTKSSYEAYPGFCEEQGALAEYNGKFMCNQYVLRGGSAATPPGHARATYRNFFGAADRWPFTTVRLARQDHNQ